MNAEWTQTDLMKTSHYPHSSLFSRKTVLQNRKLLRRHLAGAALCFASGLLCASVVPWNVFSKIQEGHSTLLNVFQLSLQAKHEGLLGLIDKFSFLKGSIHQTNHQSRNDGKKEEEEEEEEPHEPMMMLSRDCVPFWQEERKLGHTRSSSFWENEEEDVDDDDDGWA